MSLLSKQLLHYLLDQAKCIAITPQYNCSNTLTR
jgi:hypothetical protein